MIDQKGVFDVSDREFPVSVVVRRFDEIIHEFFDGFVAGHGILRQRREHSVFQFLAIQYSVVVFVEAVEIVQDTFDLIVHESGSNRGDSFLARIGSQRRAVFVFVLVHVAGRKF